MYAYDLYLFGNDAVLQEKGKATALAIRKVRGPDRIPNTTEYGVFNPESATSYTSLFDAINVLAIDGNNEARDYLFGGHVKDPKSDRAYND